MRGGGSSSSASVAAVLAAVLGGAVSAQEVPRMSWGDPDLKGIWGRLDADAAGTAVGVRGTGVSERTTSVPGTC